MPNSTCIYNSHFPYTQGSKTIHILISDVSIYACVIEQNSIWKLQSSISDTSDSIRRCQFVESIRDICSKRPVGVPRIILRDMNNLS